MTLFVRCFLLCLCACACPPLFAQTIDFPGWLTAMERFGEKNPPPAPFSLECVRQGFGEFRRNGGVLTPSALSIGETAYTRGVGTHAPALIKVSLQKPARTFRALVGIEGHPNTKGGTGSVRFSIKSADGKLLAQSPVCKGWDPAVELSADISGLSEFLIEVDDAGDGNRCDSAVLADAAVTFDDGLIAYLDGAHWLDTGRLPFAFTYAGKSSDELLKSFAHTVTAAQGARTTHTWREPAGGLVVTWTIEPLDNRQAAEFNLSFANEGARPLGVLENVRVVRQDLPAPLSVHTLTGGRNGWPANAFTPERWDGEGQLLLTASYGLSSARYLPLWLADNRRGEGLFFGLGWTGQWTALFKNDGGLIHLGAGMEVLRLSLKPGERVTQPSALVGVYRGDALAGGNALRSLIYRHYTPTLAGEKPLPPVSWNHWFVFKSNINEQNLTEQINAMRGLGVEYFCVDASWFTSNFWHVGDWRVNREKFPNGLEPVARAVKDAGMKMGLWFEPERVTEKDYAAFPRKDLLVTSKKSQPFLYHNIPINVWVLDLGKPEAQQWAVDLIGGYATKLDLKWIRYDFNYQLLDLWKELDAAEPDRLGIHEIRYIEGLYNVLDALLKNHPDMVIEWCAGGGRRIDLETLRRSHTFWKSDLTGLADKTKPQITGGNLFLPANYLNSNLEILKTDYDYVGQFGGALGFNHDFRKDTPAQWAKTKEMIALYKPLRPLLLKDYYPLFDYTSDLTKWDGWQFHDAATGKGVFMVLRPEASPYPSALVKLRALDPKKTYALTPRVGPAPAATVSGQALTDGYEIPLPSPRSAAVIEYAPLP